MKKLLSLFLIILILASCTPDENTAEDMQIWYDQCNAIQSCSDKIDELRELELTDSQLIVAIQQSIAEHEAELIRLAEEQQRLAEEQAALEQRVADLEYRTQQLEFLASEKSSLNQYLYGIDLTAALLVRKVDNLNYQIELDLDMIEADGHNISELRPVIQQFILDDLSTVIETESILLMFSYNGNVATFTLQELIDAYTP